MWLHKYQWKKKPNETTSENPYDNYLLHKHIKSIHYIKQQHSTR